MIKCVICKKPMIKDSFGYFCNKEGCDYRITIK